MDSDMVTLMGRRPMLLPMTPAHRSVARGPTARTTDGIGNRSGVESVRRQWREQPGGFIYPGEESGELKPLVRAGAASGTASRPPPIGPRSVCRRAR